MRRTVVQIILLVLCLSAQAQTVSNIRAEQRGQEIVVFYSLDTTSPCEVSLLLSQDNGATWGVPLKKVIGDVGKNIYAGEKQINWKVLEEGEQLIGDQIKFKITIKQMKNEEKNKEYKKRKRVSRDVWENIGVAFCLLIGLALPAIFPN